MSSNPVARPGGLTALCILAIVLGALGIMTGLTGLAAAALSDPLQKLAAGLQPEQDKEGARLQQQVADESREFAGRHFVRNLLFSLARLVVASCLLLGGILALRLKTPGRKALLVAFAAGILFELSQIWPMIEVFGFTERIMEMQQQMAGNAPNGGDAAGTMRVMAKMIAAMQVAMMGGMLLTKITCYAFGLWYLTRPHVAALYVRPALPEGEWR
jgi:hypothetical protein